MGPLEPAAAQAWFEYVLLWIGFGTCVGLSAKALMPGRDPGGAITTLLMGITGVVIGCGVYALVYRERISPVTPIGLVCGTLGAFILLAFYRLLGGYATTEGGRRRRFPRASRPAPLRRRRRRYSYNLDEGPLS